MKGKRSDTEQAAREMASALRGSILWNVENATFDPATGAASLHGWLLDARPGAAAGELALRVAGCDVPLTPDTRVDREDIRRIFWYLPSPEYAGFSLRAQLSCDALAAGPAPIRVVDASAGEVVAAAGRSYLLGAERYAVPTNASRKRVQGDEHLDAFLRIGYAASEALRSLVQTYGQVELSRCDVLDWGCGCGRVARYLARDSGTFTGVDIDRDNVAWCARELPGRYRLISTQPPIRLEAASFDLLFGISVFSHLTEEAQTAWLAELARLARPGAMAAFSVLGELAACRSGSRELYRQLMDSPGIVDLGADPILDGYAPEKYYRTTLHREDYIRARWSEHFEVLEVQRGAIGGGHQDLVVLRRR